MTDPKITTIYGQDTDGTWYKAPLVWAPGTPPAPPVVVPPIVVPPVVVPPPTGAVVMPKVANHYPWAVAGVTYVAPGGNIQAALAKGPVRLGIGAYSGSITMTKGMALYGMGGTMSDCSGVTPIFPDGTSGIIVSGVYGMPLPINGRVSASLFRRNKWCDINVGAAGTLDTCRVEGSEAGVNCFGGHLKNIRVIGQTKHGVADKTKPAFTIQSPNDGVSDGNVFLWSTAQSLPIGIKLSGQKRITFAAMDVEQLSTSIMETDTCGVVVASVLNGGNDPSMPIVSGFGVGADELQLIGGGFANGINPVVKSNGLKRLFTAGFVALTTSGAIGALYNETSASALLAPILAPMRIGMVWERPNLPAPADPLGPSWNVFPANYKDSTAAIQAIINGSGLLPAGTYYLDGTLTQKNGQVLYGAGDGVTVLVFTKKQNGIKWIGQGGNGSVNTFHVADMTIYGAGNGIYANNAGDQLNSCTLSFVTFQHCAAGFCAQLIYGVDNNFFDHVNFVDCAIGISQLPDPNYTTGETSTMTYFDKTVWYACQFIGCGMPANMQAKRQNNLDAFIGAIVSGCKSSGIYSGCAGLTWAWSDFLNSGVLNAQVVYPIGCNFTNTQLAGDVTGEGLIFKGNGPAFVSPGKVILLNSRPGGMTLAGTQLNCNDNAVGQQLFGAVMA